VLELRRLFPDPATVPIDEAVSDLRFRERAPADRPFVAVNMVSSVDGRATLAGHTAAMSEAADRRLFHLLRTQADGILVGAGTVRIERYGRITKTAELQAKRERAGVRPEPLAVIVSSSGRLPDDLPLLVETPASVRVVGDPAPALGELRQEGVRSLLAEGGPHLNSTLFAQGLVDELFLTIAPTVNGPSEMLTIIEGTPLPKPLDLELLTVHETGGHLFLRYRLR
jgi:riboflavin biosynthesis pyrimidine reductase